MHCDNPQFSAFELAVEAQTIAVEQCLNWQRRGAEPNDLYAQMIGRRPQSNVGWDQVAEALAGRWKTLRNGR